MKQTITLIALSLMGYVAQAQTIALYGTNGSQTIDTLANATTEYLTTGASALNTKGLSGSYAIQYTATNISGTTAITAILQSSLDGTSYTNHFKNAGTTGVVCDTLAVSGTTSHVWSIPKSISTQTSNTGRRLYFRIKMIGSGTQSTQNKAIMITQD